MNEVALRRTVLRKTEDSTREQVRSPQSGSSIASVRRCFSVIYMVPVQTIMVAGQKMTVPSTPDPTVTMSAKKKKALWKRVRCCTCLACVYDNTSQITSTRAAAQDAMVLASGYSCPRWALTNARFAVQAMSSFQSIKAFSTDGGEARRCLLPKVALTHRLDRRPFEERHHTCARASPASRAKGGAQRGREEIGPSDHDHDGYDHSHGRDPRDVKIFGSLSTSVAAGGYLFIAMRSPRPWAALKSP